MDNRIAWLKKRQTGLGATDIASLIGEGFGTPQTVYAEKVAEDITDAPPHPLLAMGLATENLNARLYSERMGVAVREKPGVTKAPGHDWAFASLDRVTDDGRILELKYTPFFGERWGDEFTDEIPNGYIVQTQWQMFAMGRMEQADVSVLSGTADHRIYRIGIDPTLIQLLLDIGGEFWNSFVRTQTPPPADWLHPAAKELHVRIEKIVADRTAVLGEDAIAVIAEYRQLKQVIKEAETEIDIRRAKIESLMGDAAKAVAGPYKLSRIVVEGGKTVSYVTKPYVRLDVREPKKKGD